MKYVAIILLCAVLCAAAVGIYAYAGARLSVVSIVMKAESGIDRSQELTALQQEVAENSFIGTAFADSVPGTDADYSFFTYTIRVKNKGLLRAEMVEVQPIPQNGDVLCYSSRDAAQLGRGIDIQKGAESDLWCVLLTSAQNQAEHRVGRTFRITYYLWGIPLSITASYQ